MPSRIDTMNGLGEGFWGKPQFHHVDIQAVKHHVKDLVLGAYFIPDGRPITPYERDVLMSQSPVAQKIVRAGEEHNRAGRDFEQTQTQLDDVTATLARLALIEETNKIAQERAASLSISLVSVSQKADAHWANVLETNSALDPLFQAEHIRPGVPLAEGAGNE